ncbi:hypothetical protein ABZV92_35745, partial [Streptomyces rubiginosohelvolus]
AGAGRGGKACLKPQLGARVATAVLLYVGDFDASGADLERDWVARTACWASVERVLLTYDQVREHELPPAEGKAGDPRWPAFARRYGLDAARPVQGGRSPGSGRAAAPGRRPPPCGPRARGRPRPPRPRRSYVRACPVRRPYRAYRAG